MAMRSIRWIYLAVVVGLALLLTGCGSPEAPAAAPTTGEVSAEVTVTPPPATEVAVITEPSQTPAVEASPAEAAPDLPAANPRWILVNTVPDVVENISTLFAVNADTGETAQVCSLTQQFSVSPNGRWVVCIFHIGKPEIKLIDLGGEGELAINSPITESIRHIVWSPDSRQVALSTEGGLYSVEVAGDGNVRQLLVCEYYRCSDVAWSPDSRLLAYGRENGLFVLDQAGTERFVNGHGIYPRDFALYEAGEILYVTDLRWSDDGQRISYATKSGVFEVEAFSDNTEQAPLSSAPYQTPGPASSEPTLSPDGTCVLEVRETRAAGLVNDPAQAPSDIIQAEYGLFVSLASNPSVVVQVSEKPFSTNAVWVAGETAPPVLKETVPAMRGCAVLEVQTLLQGRGYAVGIDGIYGTQTAEAVRDFQRDNGLDTDAVVGPATWEKLR
jgi:hypothetical protein